MRKIKITSMLMIVAGLIITTLSPAMATEYSNTVGGVIANTQTSIPYLQLFFGSVSLLAGVYLAASGLWGLQKAQEANGDHRFTTAKAMMKIFGGALLAAFPDTMNYGLMTILGVSHYTGGFVASPGTVQTCLSDAVNASALSCVAKNVGVNVVPIAVKFMFAGCMLVGSYIIIKSLYLIATDSDHGRTTKGQLWGRFIVGVIACNVPMAMFVIQNTLGFSNGVITTTGSVLTGDTVPSILTYNPDSSVAILKQFSETISWCFVFLSMVGVLAFVRGLAQLYGIVSGGHGHKTMLSVVLHMVFGVILANIKAGGCLVVSTTISQSMGLCS